MFRFLKDLFAPVPDPELPDEVKAWREAVSYRHPALDPKLVDDLAAKYGIPVVPEIDDPEFFIFKIEGTAGGYQFYPIMLAILAEMKACDVEV